MADDIIREMLMEKALIVFNPKEIDTEAREFMSKYASYMEKAAIIAKAASGHAYYESDQAPVDDSMTEFFEEWIELSNALEIDTVVAMNYYSDSKYAQNPEVQTLDSNGNASLHHVCPNRRETWEYGAGVVKELSALPIDEILVLGTGYLSEKFCFCDTCRKEFSPKIGINPEQLSYKYLADHPSELEEWREWRRMKFVDGIASLHEANTAPASTEDDMSPPQLSIEVLIDPSTGLVEGSKNHNGYDLSRIRNLTGSILVNLYPWTPRLDSIGSKDYEELVEDLYFVREFNRRGGTVTLFRWAVDDLKEIQALKTLANEVGAGRVAVTLGYPPNYSDYRENAMPSY